MKKQMRPLFQFIQLLSITLTAVFLTIGCSLLNPPTASNEAGDPSADYWTPQIGDEIVPGRQIPIIMDENYWETPGMVNPNMRGLSGAMPTLITGSLGGTVSCGNHRFVVPAGAVDGSVNFTMALASGSGIAVDCGPSPLFFADGSPVRITLSYAGTQYDPDYCRQRGIEPLDASQLQIWYMATDGSLQQQSSDRMFDAGTKTITVQVSHFSRYILA